ncbi:MAG TPA: c-type cytochrome [Gammaproteobacteria bacterium]|nr:c-type cytochrome [Gammaproteobacteria bacterium]
MDQDRKFLDTFLIVIGALVAMTIVIFFIATGVEKAHLDPDNLENPLAQQAVTDRIRPIGEVATTDNPRPAPVTTAPSGAEQAREADAEVSGEAVFTQACFACHGTGAAGAPRPGDKAQWEPRIAKGMEVLYQHSLEGFTGNTGIMPPKGGRMDLSDEQVKAAVDYMVEQSR